MRKINKNIKIAFIFMLIGVFVWTGDGYALRPPLLCSSTERASKADISEKTPFEEPVYGDGNYWFGNLGITLNDLANLGLIKRRYEYGMAKDSWYLDDVFSQFRGAPNEVLKRLIARIQKPERNHARIMVEHEKILSIIEYMRKHYDDQAAKKLRSLSSLVRTYSLQNSNRSVDLLLGRSSAQSSFGEALRILRNKHYPKGKSGIKMAIGVTGHYMNRRMISQKQHGCLFIWLL